MNQACKPEVIFTIGHSTRTAEDFIALLQANHIKALADVRRYPGSKRYPHFSASSLAQSLPAAGIQFVPFLELGGRRKSSPDSVNQGWRNEGFRAYADYMATLEFQSGIRRLINLANTETTAIMCAEGVPWRCHRNLISDYLVTVEARIVRHIISQAAPDAHSPTPFLKLENGIPRYPKPSNNDVQLDLF